MAKCCYLPYPCLTASLATSSIARMWQPSRMCKSTKRNCNDVVPHCTIWVCEYPLSFPRRLPHSRTTVISARQGAQHLPQSEAANVFDRHETESAGKARGYRRSPPEPNRQWCSCAKAANATGDREGIGVWCGVAVQTNHHGSDQKHGRTEHRGR